MLEFIRNLLIPPAFSDDEEKTRVAGLLNSILLTLIVITIALVLPGLLITTDPANRLLLVLLIVPSVSINIATLILMRRGRVQLASNIFLINVSLAIFGAYAVSESAGRDSLSIIILFALATLLFDPRAILRLLVLSLCITLFVTIGHQQGWLPKLLLTTKNPFGFWFSNSVIFIIASLGFYFASQGLRRALESSRTARERLQASNRELDELSKSLEQRVSERASDLEKRASQLEAIAQTARSAATARNLEELLSTFTQDISLRFGFYHIGIFLVDSKREFAILSATNSAGGSAMLERGHRLRVGEQGIVGYVAHTGNPRIASDVGADAAFFNNPDLPETRSEVALPLKYGHEIIGALDIQSKEPNAFLQEDIRTFSVLADQISIAIQNVRSLEQAQRALHEAEIASSQLTGQAWKGYLEKSPTKGYRFDGIKPEPLQPSSKLSDDKNMLSIPVSLRGQIIGRLKIRTSNPAHQWTEDELAILESTAGRVALALDGARLLDEAQKRALRETFLSEIGAKLGTSFQLDSILRDTVEELGQILNGSTVSFQLVNPAAPPTPEAGKDNGSGSQR